MAIGDSHTVAMPIAKDCYLALGEDAKDDVLLSSNVRLFNELQMDSAFLSWSSLLSSRIEHRKLRRCVLLKSCSARSLIVQPDRLLDVRDHSSIRVGQA